MKITLALVRNTLLVVFIAATLTAFAILVRESSLVRTIAQTASPNAPEEDQLVFQLELEKVAPVMASIITSLTTLVGFILTTILNVRKEVREVRESSLSLKQKELDLQRALIELEQLKKKLSPSS
jgi:hypothetical protein